LIPATSANLGPGFDCLGLALSLYNEVLLEETGEPGVEVRLKGEGVEILGREERNLAREAVEFLFQRAGRRAEGLRLELENRVPLGRGLGSSACAIAGGLVAANLLLGSPFAPEELFQMAAELEGHPDNVAPALFGGFQAVVRVEEGYIRLPLPLPQGVEIHVLIPSARLPTAAARKVLPDRVFLADAVFNLQRVAMLPLALSQGRGELLPHLLRDRLHQPYRLPLLPGWEEALESCFLPPLLGGCLSGSGPSLLAFSPRGAKGVEVALGRVASLLGKEGEVRILTLGVSPRGALEAARLD
jgi:homoserine kinase